MAVSVGFKNATFDLKLTNVAAHLVSFKVNACQIQRVVLNRTCTASLRHHVALSHQFHLLLTNFRIPVLSYLDS